METDLGSWLLTSGAARRLALEGGAEIDAERLDEAAMKVQPPAARKDTGRYLARSEHTASQLRGYLGGRQYHPSVVDRTVEWASRLGYVDDVRFARSYVRSHRGGRSPMGVRRLRLELRKRGVSAEDAEAALVDSEDRDIEEDLVRGVRKRYGHLPDEKARRRALGYMSRRGFPYDLSRRVVNRALNGGSADGEPEDT